MPLIERCNIAAFEENIRIEIRAGTPAPRATATARDLLERTCRKEGKPIPKKRIPRNG